MTGRERFLTALSNERPDRLPCQVHSWMGYYLHTYLHDMDQYQAYEYFGMDPVIYENPKYIYNEADLAKWEEKWTDLGEDASGNHNYIREIITPKGVLTEKRASNQFTGWITEPMIKTEKDFELWKEFVPLPEKVDWTPVIEAKKRIGDKGIVRGSFFDFGQGSPWQSYVNYLTTVEDGIFKCFDTPDYVHYVLKTMLDKKMKVIERAGKFEYDLVECGGGAGSSTVISPEMHETFCLPYDKIQIKAIQEQGAKVVYHLCGGLMPLLEIVEKNGANALETMTPPEMGGDCDLAEADRRIGEKMCFVGGFDQNHGFEKGTKEFIEETVHKLFEAKKHGGYIISPSDHFFFGNPENIQYFVDVCKECRY